MKRRHPCLLPGSLSDDMTGNNPWSGAGAFGVVYKGRWRDFSAASILVPTTASTTLVRHCGDQGRLQGHQGNRQILEKQKRAASISPAKLDATKAPVQAIEMTPDKKWLGLALVDAQVDLGAATTFQMLP